VQEQEDRKERILEETRELRRQFRIAAVGCKILWFAYLLYSMSLMLILAFLIQNAVMQAGLVILLYLAALLGTAHFLLVPVGLGIMLAGPNRAAMKGYAITAMLFALLHMPLLMGGVAQARNRAQALQRGGEVEDIRLTNAMTLIEVPTQLPSMGSYLVIIFYPDYSYGLPGYSRLVVLSGVVEALQLLFAMLTLMSLARAAGDDDLGISCLRAAARVIFLIGGLVFGLLIFMAVMIETGALQTRTGTILFHCIWMSTRGLVALTLILPIRRAQEVMDCCHSPILVDENYR